MIERLAKFIDYQGISISSFEKIISASDGMIRRAIRNNTDIQSKWITKISDNFPELSIDWLVSGNGSMLKEKENIPVAVKTENLHEGIPLIPLDAMAGWCRGEMQVMEYECEHYVIPAFREAEFLIPVKGSSMYPKYSSGDIVACKKLSLKDVFFQPNKVYVLDTDQGALIKRVKKGRDDNHIILVSENEKYEPFELSLHHLHAIAIVVGVIRLE